MAQLWSMFTKRNSYNVFAMISKKNFRQSRFYYFKKHSGFLKAIFIECFLSINKRTLFLFLIISFFLFNSLYKLDQNMVFIGDQGWFYLSARDMVLNHNIPLVGITSSHTWLHQGPLWTYFLSLAFLLFSFNPLSGAYITIFFGGLSIILIYILGKEIRDEKLGLITALLYSVSPLVVFYSRFPYHTSLIPFFVLLLLFFLFRWIKEKLAYFPLIILVFGLLYNLELATFSLVISVILVEIYGLFKKKQWAIGIFNRKTIFFSFVSFLISMLPILVYDLQNGFKQTLVFSGWIIYKPIAFLLNSSGTFSIEKLSNLLKFLLQNLNSLLFSLPSIFSILLLMSSVAFLIYLRKRERQSEGLSLLILLLFLVFFSTLTLLVNMTVSDAYLPMFFPMIIILISFFVYSLFKIARAIAFMLIFIFLVLSLWTTYKYNGRDLGKRINASREIIKLSQGKQYTIEGKGIGSEFESFTANYEYLTWWLGHGPSKKEEKLKFYIEENSSRIQVEEKIRR